MGRGKMDDAAAERIRRARGDKVSSKIQRRFRRLGQVLWRLLLADHGWE